MRKDYFFAGLGMRILMLMVFIIVNHYDHYNDMSEIIYYAMNNMLRGENPYAVMYEIEWGSGTFYQPFNYGPVTLLMLLPAMALPYWYNSFWLGMYVMNNVYSYLLSEYLMKYLAYDKGLQKENSSLYLAHKDKNQKKTKNQTYSENNSQNNSHLYELELRKNRGIYYAGIFLWLLPFGTLVVTNFLMLPILFVTLAFGERKSPFWCSFFITMGAMCYQMVLLFIPVFAAYHYKQDIKNVWYFILGAIPASLFFMIFMVWGPGGIIYSTFLYTSEMGYVKCPTCDHTFDNWSVFSIPKLLYVLSDGQIQIGNLTRVFLVFLLGVSLLLYIFRDDFGKYDEKYIQKYLMYAVLGFVLTNNYGQVHYFLLGVVPLLIYLQIKNPDYRKEVPIGMGINNWQQFEKYLLKYHELPE